MLSTLDDGTVPDTSITYGTRNQYGTLPAITYQILSHETLTVGAAPLRKATVEINSITKEAQTTQELSEAVKATFDPDTYDSLEFQAIVNQNNILQEPESGNGEEATPYIATTTIDIYYKETT
jgi:hypothetical protein